MNTAELLAQKVLLIYRMLATQFIRRIGDPYKQSIWLILYVFNLTFYAVLIVIETPFFFLANQIPGVSGLDIAMLFVFFNVDITIFLFLLNWFDNWQTNAPKKRFYQVIGLAIGIKLIMMIMFHFLVDPQLSSTSALILEFIFDTEAIVFFFYLNKFYRRVRNSTCSI